LRFVRRLGALLLSGLALGVGLGLGLHLVPSGPAIVVAAPALPAGTAADFTDVARRSASAVVNISALQVFRAEGSPFLSDPFFRQFFGQNHPFHMPQDERKLSLGSGVVVSADGVIVTNHHVVEHASRIVITTPDRRRHEARLVGSDPATDIAVIRLTDGKGLSALEWGDSGQARVGEYVLAVGNPFQLNQTVTMGIISAVGRSNVGIVDYEDFIQTDAAINPGNSGGALVNVRGELIGINSAIYSETGGYQGIGFAVPSNLARRIADEIVAHGSVVRGWVGITRVKDVDDDMLRQLGLKDVEGVVVLEMLRGSPADRAGLEPGDVVVTVDGRPVGTATQLRNDLAAAHVGTEIRLGVLREGRPREIRIRVEKGPGDA
jgi:serine protease Do